MNLSSYAKCLTIQPQNLPVIPAKLRTLTIFNQTPPLQIHGRLIKLWGYSYKTCDEEWINQKLRQNAIGCECLSSWKKCRPKNSYIEACNTILIAFVSSQIIISIIGIIMNLFITIPFCRDADIRKRNANILIFNQATADLVNCVVYGVPNAINLLRATIRKKEVPYQVIITQATVVFTIASSIFTFSVIAIERYLSISRPLWYKGNIRKKHLYTSIVILWIFSTFLASMRVYTILHGKDKIYLQFAQVFLGLLMALVVIIFILTFKAAHHAVSNSPSDSSNGERNKLILKKKIRLSIMFLLMFIVFIFGFIPVVMTTANGYYLYASTQALLLPLCLTSVFNALLVLCFMKRYRIRRGQERRQCPQSIDMESTTPRTSNMTGSTN